MATNSDLEGAMRVALTRSAGIFAAKARSKAQSNNVPKNIPGAIEVGQFQANGTTYKITVSVDLKKAPAAAAYEYGSGIHATKKTPAKYPILPKNKKFLAFKWPKVDGDPRFRRLPDGRVVLPSVDHPGVEAKPYMMPAFQESKAEIRQLIGQEFRLKVLGKIVDEEIKVQ